MEILDFVAAKFHEEPGIFKLLIVDSIMALFRVDYSGRGELADRQQHLAQMMSRLQKVSEEYNVAVFITNQMTADPGAALSFQVNFTKVINIIFKMADFFNLGGSEETYRRQYTCSCKYNKDCASKRSWRESYCQNLRQS